MNEFDYSALDGRSLRVFLTVLEEGSVSAAARHLGLTQSAVSHTLDKLRRILGDPLFVRAGRGIVATRRAEAMAAPVRRLLDEMRVLTAPPAFDPRGARLQMTVAANDYQRDLLLPDWFGRVSRAVERFSLKVIPSGIPSPGVLDQDRCDLLITPRPPAGPDIIQKRLLTDRMVCFYDASVRAAPMGEEAFLAARHLVIEFNSGELSTSAALWGREDRSREVAVSVANFAGIPPFLRGSDFLATLPSLLRFGLLAGFAWTAVPIELPELSLYMVWHRRNHLDPGQRWLRSRLEEVSQALGMRSVIGSTGS